MEKSYKTFFNVTPSKDFYDLDNMDDFDDPFIIRQNCVIPNGFYLVIILWSVFMITNMSGLVVGAVHNNITCDENKLIMSLGTWLISMTSVTIICSIMFIMIYLLSMCILIRESNCFSNMIYPFKLYVGLFIIYILIMIFIGVVELVSQSELCFLENMYIFIIVIVIMVINFWGMCVSCKIKIR